MSKLQREGLRQLLAYGLGTEAIPDGFAVRALLLEGAAAYVPDPDDVFVAAVAADELTTVQAPAYARVQVTGLDVTADATDDLAVVTSGAIAFPNLAAASGTVTINACVLYLDADGLTDATRPIVEVVTFTPTALDGTTFEVDPPIDGLGAISV